MTDEGRPRLQKPTWEEGKRLLAWLGAHFLGGLLPVWGSLVLVTLFGQSTRLSDYVSHGEFALYAAATAGGSLYIIFREIPVPFPFRSALGLVSVIVVVVATVIFSGVFVFHKFLDASAYTQHLDLSFLSRASIVLYVLSVLLALATMLIDLLRGQYDPQQLPKKDLADLIADFRAEGDQP